MLVLFCSITPNVQVRNETLLTTKLYILPLGVDIIPRSTADAGFGPSGQWQEQLNQLLVGIGGLPDCLSLINGIDYVNPRGII